MLTRPPAAKLLQPRWLAGHLLALTLVALFIGFGFWQLDRGEQRAQRNELLTTRLAEPVRPLAELTDRYGVAPAALAWRTAQAEGWWDAEREVLLRSRSRNGSPGWHVLTPLLLESGEALLVDRGWVPYEHDEPPVEAAAPPEGRVRLTGLLQEPQLAPTGFFAGLAPRDPPGERRSFFYADPARIAPQLPYPVLPFYLALEGQQPPGGELPIPAEAPTLEAGPHLGYAVQWFSFALVGIVGYALLLRSVLRGE